MRWILVLILLLPAAAELHGQAVERNLEDARAAVRRNDWKEAEIAARAALRVDAAHQEAHLLLHEALKGAGDQAGSLLSALDAHDAPKRGNRTAANHTRAARNAIKAASPELDAFLGLRAEQASALLRFRGAASRARRGADVEWLEDLLFRMAPTDPAVARATNNRSEQHWRPRGEGPALNRVAAGFRSLLETPEEWIFRFADEEKSKVTQTTLNLVRRQANIIPTAALFLPHSNTGEGFTLRAQIRWTGAEDVPEGAEVSFFIQFPTSQTEIARSAILFAFGPTRWAVAFSLVEERAFLPRTRRHLPPAKAGAGKWIDLEVHWEFATNEVKVSVDGELLLTAPTDESPPRDCYIGFGTQNCQSVEIRNLQMKQLKD